VGGSTPFSAAQASFCSSVKQQQSFQQLSALMQPQARVAHGNGLLKSFSLGRGNGTPKYATAYPASTSNMPVEREACRTRAFQRRRQSFELAGRTASTANWPKRRYRQTFARWAETRRNFTRDRSNATLPDRLKAQTIASVQ
jgi:hypothetical protein